MTNVNITRAVQPKSDQLNADDLIDGARTFTITNVREAGEEQPIAVDLAEYERPYKPCKSMLRVMLAAWGADARDWIGQKITVYCDPDVVFGGVRVGGIRISHMTGITESRDFMLTTTRSKRKPHTVHPLTVKPYPDAQFKKNLPAWGKAIADGKYTAQQIIAKCEEKGALSDQQIAEIEALAQEDDDDVPE